MVEGAALEKQCASQEVPWVRIPPSPPKLKIGIGMGCCMDENPRAKAIAYTNRGGVQELAPKSEIRAISPR